MKIKISKSEWTRIGKQTGWIKIAEIQRTFLNLPIELYNENNRKWVGFNVKCTIRHDILQGVPKITQIDIPEISTTNGPNETFYLRGGETLYTNQVSPNEKLTNKNVSLQETIRTRDTLEAITQQLENVLKI